MRRYKKEKQEQKKIAKERIGTLFSRAQEAFPKDPALADRYVALARKISQKYRVRIPSGYKRRFCRHCYSYLVTGTNARTRIRDKFIVTFCERCRRYSKFGIAKKNKKKPEVQGQKKKTSSK
jgi:ribonuclease P protein subunit RPR2